MFVKPAQAPDKAHQTGCAAVVAGSGAPGSSSITFSGCGGS
jgi:hypothetical protein